MFYALIKDGKIKHYRKNLADLMRDCEVNGIETSEIVEVEKEPVFVNGNFYFAGEAPAEEYSAELAAEARAERDRRIDAVRWRIERYQTQKAADLPTTDTAEQYQALLIYVQALRDVPEQAGFPNIIEWPVIEEKKENRKDTEEPDITPESESTEEIE